MRSKLIFKFAAIFAVIGILSFTLLSFFGARALEKQIIRSEGRSIYNEAASLAENPKLLNARTTGDSAAAADDEIYTLLHTLAAYQGSVIWLIDPNGTVYATSSAAPSAYTPIQLENFDPVALGSGYYTVGRFFGSFNEDYVSVMVPIVSNMRLRGYVAIHSSMSKIIQQREQYLLIQHKLSIMVFALFLSVFFLLYFHVLRPLKKIQAGIREFAKGNLKYNIPVDTQDEMGSLASSLNAMSDEMEKTGEYQKNFIANVSHDFRSPLTSIKGFVEAMLDGTIPPEMQEKYLHIVLNETDRLTKLTNGILTLNSMDRKEANLHITDFDINAVARNTAAAFEGICRPRSISIQLTLTGSELYVSADREKIQQVLYNLIDNAIKFSSDNSSIEIDTTIRHDKIYVTVRDHGVGIASGALKKIWDRFYKTDASRGRERKGNGLGLSIVKEIINQHEQNITVISTEGVGTEFVFSLAAANSEK
ncbi:MAG: HAMP domain-containing sensor histidine kinase [Eubacteriales bacterium]|nr:HAMP domain-containing sensor histidine kinase [Eubacteriales bacterium]